MSERIAAALASVAISGATALVIVALAVAPFLSPAYVNVGQERSGAVAATGFSAAELRAATEAILADLVVGPPAFDVEVRGEPVLTERERAHLRDVRTVFLGLGTLAAASAVVLVAAWRGGVRDPSGFGMAVRRAVRRGAVVLAVAVVALGATALLAFDVLFELFHRLLFADGTYTFDPQRERLVQLFPYTFWLETALAVGAVIVALAAVVAVAVGRVDRADRRATAGAVRPAERAAQ